MTEEKKKEEGFIKSFLRAVNTPREYSCIEEELFEMEQRLCIPQHLRYHNKDKNNE